MLILRNSELQHAVNNSEHTVKAGNFVIGGQFRQLHT
jgi:hypothetical protein